MRTDQASASAPVSLTGCLLGGFAGAFGAYLGARDLAGPDDLSRFGAHGWAFQRQRYPPPIHEILAIRGGDRASLWSSAHCGSLREEAPHSNWCGAISDETMVSNRTPMKVERLLDAPVIYFDRVPTVGIRGQTFNALLAVQVEEETGSTSTDHLVAVANLRFSVGTAAQFRDLLDKMLLAARASPGPAN
jgi:hypothetical protein